MKKMLNCTNIRKMQTKNTMKCHPTPVRSANYPLSHPPCPPPKEDNKCWQGCKQIKTLASIGGNVKQCKLL